MLDLMNRVQRSGLFFAVVIILVIILVYGVIVAVEFSKDRRSPVQGLSSEEYERRKDLLELAIVACAAEGRGTWIYPGWRAMFSWFKPNPHYDPERAYLYPYAVKHQHSHRFDAGEAGLCVTRDALFQFTAGSEQWEYAFPGWSFRDRKGLFRFEMPHETR